jgi:hypothetical protein
MKIRIMLVGLLSLVSICLAMWPMQAAEAQGEVTTLEPWLSKLLPGQSHQLPSWGRGGWFYVHTFRDQAIYRTSISASGFTEWQNAGNYAGGPQGFVALVADNTPYAFRNGHVLRYNIDASNNIVSQSCLEAGDAACAGSPSNAFGDLRYFWDSAAYVPLATKYIFHLGGFEMVSHGYSVNTIHRKALPMTPPVHFAPVGNAPTTRPYRAAFYKASDAYGFIYMGTLEQTLWRIRVNANGYTGPWEIAHRYPTGENDRGDMFVIDDQLFVIRGKKVYQATINAATGALSAWRDDPPDLSELQVTVLWGAGEPEPASYGIVGDYVCVTGSTRVFCAHIKRSQSSYGIYLPLQLRF